MLHGVTLNSYGGRISYTYMVQSFEHTQEHQIIIFTVDELPPSSNKGVVLEWQDS